MPGEEGHTLRRQFGLRAFLISLAILETATVATGLIWHRRATEAVVEGLTAHIQSVESGLELDLEVGVDPLSANGTTLLPSPETGVQVVSTEGVVLAASAHLVDAPPVIPITDLESRATGTTVVTDETLGRSLVKGEWVDIGGRRVAVEAIAPLDDVDSAARLTWLIGLLAILLAAAIGTGVALSVDRALRPVRALARRASAIAAGRRPLRLEVDAPTAELRDLADRLDHLLDVIRAAFDREQTFLDDASHELRTPIAIAQAELDLARRTTDDPATAGALDSALDELRRLDHTAGDLLVLARARAAGTEGFEAVDVGSVARRATTVVRRDPRQRPVALHVSGEGVVSGDPHALERALTNIIANAAEHCTASVDVDVTTSGDHVVATIADDGPGIPTHLLDGLFDRFSRGQSHQAHSTGLGTAIAAEVVSKHGGTIEAANRHRGGAVVTITLPALDQGAVATTPPGA